MTTAREKFDEEYATRTKETDDRDWMTNAEAMLLSLASLEADEAVKVMLELDAAYRNQKPPTVGWLAVVVARLHDVHDRDRLRWPDELRERFTSEMRSRPPGFPLRS